MKRAKALWEELTRTFIQRHGPPADVKKGKKPTQRWNVSRGTLDMHLYEKDNDEIGDLPSAVLQIVLAMNPESAALDVAPSSASVQLGRSSDDLLACLAKATATSLNGVALGMSAEQCAATYRGATKERVGDELRFWWSFEANVDSGAGHESTACEFKAGKVVGIKVTVNHSKAAITKLGAALRDRLAATLGSPTSERSGDHVFMPAGAGTKLELRWFKSSGKAFVLFAELTAR